MSELVALASLAKSPAAEHHAGCCSDAGRAAVADSRNRDGR
jgi:hypothetical protein